MKRVAAMRTKTFPRWSVGTRVYDERRCGDANEDVPTLERGNEGVRNKNVDNREA